MTTNRQEQLEAAQERLALMELHGEGLLLGFQGMREACLELHTQDASTARLWATAAGIHMSTLPFVEGLEPLPGQDMHPAGSFGQDARAALARMLHFAAFRGGTARLAINLVFAEPNDLRMCIEARERGRFEVTILPFRHELYGLSDLVPTCMGELRTIEETGLLGVSNDLCRLFFALA